MSQAPHDPTTLERDVAEVHPELQDLFRAVRAASAEGAGRSIEELRAQPSMVSGLIEEVDLAEVRDLVIPTPGGSIPARLYRPHGTRPTPGHVHLHGGAWVLGSVANADPGARLLAALLGAVVVSVDYRLAPEHPWPAAPEDCFAATSWVAAHAAELDIDPTQLTVGGDSAGANLAAVVALMCRDRGGPSLRAQWLAVGAFDLTLPDTDSMRRYGQGFVVDRDDLARYIDLYVASGDRRAAYATPTYADLWGLPPAVVISASCDPLYDQSVAFAYRLRAADVAVAEVRCAGHLHGSMYLTRATPSGRRHLEEAAAAFVSLRSSPGPVQR